MPRAYERCPRRRALCVGLVLALLCAALPPFSLPVQASPGVAAAVTYAAGVTTTTDEGYTSSSLWDNWWKSSGSGTDSRLTYQGGWVAGGLDGGGFHPFTYVNRSDSSWLMLDETDQWQSAYGTVGRNGRGVSPHGGGYATGYAYTVPEGGTVTVSLSDCSFRTGDGFAIFRNGTMLWPTAGAGVGTGGDISAYYLLAQEDGTALRALLAAQSFTVEAGDVLSFVCKRGSGSGQHVYYPTVSYRAPRAAVEDASLFCFQGENYPQYTYTDGAYRLKEGLSGGWSLGARSKSDPSVLWSLAKLNDHYCILNQNGGDKNTGNQWTYGGLYLKNGVVITANGHMTVFSYEIPYHGAARVSLDSITVEQSQAGEDILFCVCRDGTMLWPVAGGALGDMENWYALTADGATPVSEIQAAPALQKIEVAAGDRIEFCFTARNGHSMSTQTPSLRVTMVERVVSLPTPESLGSTATLPLAVTDAAGEGSLLATRGRWQCVSSPRRSGQAEELTVLHAGQLTAGDAAAMAQNGAVSLRGEEGAVFTPGTARDVGWSYTVRYGGRVVLSPGVTCTAGRGEDICLTLYHNGAPVWRENGEKAGTGAHTLTVQAGDTLYLALSTATEEKAAPVCRMTPAIRYEELTATMAYAGMQMDPTQGLAITFYMVTGRLPQTGEEQGLLLFHTQADAYTYAAAGGVHLAAGNVRPDGSIAYTYTGCLPQSLGDTLYLRPYIRCTDGTVEYGEVCPVCPLDYLLAQYGTDPVRNTLLTDLVLYAAAVQTCFAPGGAPLSDCLTSAQRTCASPRSVALDPITAWGKTPGEAERCYSRITGVRLRMTAEWAFAVQVEVDTWEAGNLFLDVLDEAGAVRQAIPVPEDGMVMCPAFSPADCGQGVLWRLRCVDGSAVYYGPTLRYSFSSYIAGVLSRTADLGDREADLVVRLALYGRSAAVCAAG